MRGTASPESPQSSSPVRRLKGRGGRPKRGKSKPDMAGLVGGDSDSSALTQESGDEGATTTPRDSVMTGTEEASDEGEEDDADPREESAGKLLNALLFLL